MQWVGLAIGAVQSLEWILTDTIAAPSQPAGTDPAELAEEMSPVRGGGGGGGDDGGGSGGGGSADLAGALLDLQPTTLAILALATVLALGALCRFAFHIAFVVGRLLTCKCGARTSRGRAEMRRVEGGAGVRTHVRYHRPVGGRYDRW